MSFHPADRTSNVHFIGTIDSRNGSIFDTILQGNTKFGKLLVSHTVLVANFFVVNFSSSSTKRLVPRHLHLHLVHNSHLFLLIF